MIATEPMETIHLYYEPEEPQPPASGYDAWIVLTTLLLFVVVIWQVCSLPPTVATVTVPARFLPLQHFTVQEQLVPTGMKIYPATYATGTLTLTNGSVIGMTLPQGFTIGGVATDRAVYVPPGSANGFGYAIVPAHALLSGRRGNIPALSINTVIGSALYVRNLTAFMGGHDAYTLKFITARDRQIAYMAARNRLALQRFQIRATLFTPCQQKTDLARGMLTVSLTCRFVTYKVPSYMHVQAVKLTGAHFLLDVVIGARPAQLGRR